MTRGCVGWGFLGAGFGGDGVGWWVVVGFEGVEGGVVGEGW